MTTEDEPQFRIGEVAKKAGVSTRTLRYYQELGLLDPAGASPGGSRRDSEDDLARLRRILELRDIMGFDLDRINAILHAEDRLAELREEMQAGVSTERRGDVVVEAITINNGMRKQVMEKLELLGSFMGHLDEKAVRCRQVAGDLDIDIQSDELPPPRTGATPARTGE